MGTPSKDIDPKILYTKEAGTGLVISKEDIELLGVKDAKKAGFDFVGQLDRMAKVAQHRRSGTTTGLKLVDFEPMTGLLDTKAEALEDPFNRLLREAKTLIQQKQYAKAVRPLQGALGRRPHHIEATYLLAYCLAHHDPPKLEYDEQALRLLLALSRMQIDHTVQTRVRTVRDLIRGRRSPRILAQNLALLIGGQFDRSIELLRHEIQLDPEMGPYYYMLGGGLLMVDRLQEAHEAVSLGLQVGTVEDQTPLRDLMTEVETRMAIRALEPARQCYKRGKYAQARSALKDVPKSCLQTRLFALFQDYLTQLGGTTSLFGLLKTRGKTPSEVRPVGNMKDLDTLGFFLVGDEVGQARNLLNHGGLAQARQAEDSLARALEQAPFFAFVNYLYGSAIFVRLREEIESGRPPSIETAEADLRRAREHVRAAEVDPEIGGIPAAARTIDKILKMFAEAKKEHQKRVEEARRINAAIEEYGRIMDSVKDGLTSIEEFQRVRAAIEKLRQQLPSLTRATTSAEGKKAVQQLGQALNKRLSELESVQKDLDRRKEEARPVNEAITEYQRIMDYAQSGLQGLEDCEQIRDRLQALDRKLTSLERNIRDPQGKKAVRDLRQAVTARLKELDLVLKQLGY